MSFAFKLSHRLARNFWVVGIAAALAGCTVEKSIANPSTPPDTSTVTPPPPAPQPKPASGFFVAPNGLGSASGSLGAPWDLTTALNGASGRVHAGDTIWGRGGTYYPPFRGSGGGRASAPRGGRAYPGGGAIIHGVKTPPGNFGNPGR